VVFLHYPQIKALKENLYALGAVYASMSGSGSTVYGLFNKEIKLPASLPAHHRVIQL
jgi:4-diphosphocytidyl-2-C-methyl-D-erythritol kinase